MKRWTGLAAASATAFLLLVAAPAAAMSDYEILKMADQARGNVEGIAWEVVIEAVERGRTDTMKYDIKARGFHVAGISLAPPKHRGNKLLMLDNHMWFYKPGLSKPVPVSQRQKLMGNASYGDIASTNYADDYEAEPLPDERVGGRPCYVFDLRAKNSRTTYDRVKYWIAKDDLVGVKAEYYTLSGRKIKSARMDYDNTVVIDGARRPFISRIAIYEELMSGDVTTLRMTKPRLDALPDRIFNLNLFMR